MFCLKSNVLNLSDNSFNLALSKKDVNKVIVTKNNGHKIIEFQNSLPWNFNIRGKLKTSKVFAGVGRPTK